MHFTKMQGCGNDFVLLDALSGMPDSVESLAKSMCDRKFGIGADGLILVLPSEECDLRMRFFNADGSEAEMCGNGVRCFARFALAHGMVGGHSLKVETPAGPIQTEILGEKVRVDMGTPILEGDKIPVGIPQPRVINAPLPVEDREFEITCVSMGNPHCVIFVPEIEDDHVTGWGPKIETHPLFPRKTNVEFAQVLGPKAIRMRVWERGSGETLACGTGACATAVAGVLTGRTERQCVLHLAGGDLQIEWQEESNRVFMTGPAETVFTGQWPGPHIA